MKITLFISRCILAGFLIFSVSAIAQKKQKSQKLNQNVNISQISGVSNSNPKFKKAFEKVAKETNVSELKRLELQYQIEHTSIKSNLASYALLNNIQMRIVQDDKTMELQRVLEDGSLIYYETYNVAAARSTRTDWLNTGGGLGLDLNGNGLTANVWDGGHGRITHNEYDGTGGNNRLVLIDTGSEGGTQLNFHAAHVTGTIMASGQGGQTNSKGMAWQANVRGAMWNNDIAEATAEAATGMLVSNHSYGFGASGIPDEWFGAYLTESEAWDNIMQNAPYYLMVVAAGNDGQDNTSNDSPLNGNASFDKLSGHAVSKNNLVIANGQDANINVDGSLNSVSRNAGSSEGPSDDFRVKPDLMGNGTQLYSTYDNADNAYNSITGTSMASPNVTGSLLLLQEHYNDLNGSFMRAATLKGLALHTADDVAAVGPDSETGWGLMNSKKAAETLTTAAAASGSAIVDELTLTQGQTYQIMVQSNGSDPLQASISWTDPEGNGYPMTVDGSGNAPFSANANNPTLVNDLDIRVNNGTVSTPWRLTNVNANGTGDNSSDPFERIDINGASGTYTITVTHKGTLTDGPQNYSLIVTGVIVATVPEIAFSTDTGNEVENSDCGFTDVFVPLTIALEPSEAADVIFAVNVSSSATVGADFDLITPSVTFGTSGTTSQNMILRVYHDDIVEGTETIDIDFTVNANTGDAVANTNADNFTLTLTDDDVALVVPGTVVTLYNEDFDDGDYELTTSGNAGSAGFSVGNAAGLASTYWSVTGNATSFAFTSDDVCNCDKSNDVITTFSIDMSASYSTAELSFDHAFANISTEVGSVLISTNGGTSFTSVLNLTNTSTNPSNDGFTFVTPWVNNITLDMTPYIGQNEVQVQFKYDDGGGWLYGMAVDNIEVTAVSNTMVQTAVNAGDEDLVNIKGNGTSVALDAPTGNVMAEFVNNAADDYGCVTVGVNRAGTGAQAYNGSTGANRVMDKRFSVSPTNTITSGNSIATLYFTEGEIAGWEGITLRNRSELVIARESSGVIVETAAATIGSFGSNVTLSGTFTGLSDTFYIGPIEAFSSPCSGVLKTWTAGGWSPSGAPTTNDIVEINDSSYNWLLGDIEACTLKVNSGITFTIPAGNFIEIENNIVVDGTLIVAHQGSVVQTDPTAQVINNGTINVIVTTPVLQTRDFMIMGSPMTTEARDAVWNTPFLILGFNPGNFIPHGDVPAGGTNWADDNGDFYSAITGSVTINPAEGYIVRPQDSYTDPANEAYTFTYSQGTLNNGTISYTATNNGSTNNPNGTPNVVANPYPSAINADMFMTTNGLSALYFWEHLTPPGTGLPGSNLRFDMEDISIRNMGMGMPAGNDAGNAMGTAPSNEISTGQGFGVRTTGADGTTQGISFTNAMRLTTGNTTLGRPTGETETILLEVRNTDYSVGGFAGLAFTDNATANLDQGYDTNRLATLVSLYSHLEDGSGQLAIQSREVFNPEMEIPFGFATQADEDLSYTISLNTVTGENVSEVDVFIVDRDLNLETNLSETSYTFRASKGVQDTRFLVYFEERVVLGTEDLSLNSIRLYPNPTNSIINISAPKLVIEAVTIYDLQGRKVASKSFSENSTPSIDISNLKTSVYFVTITTSKGSVTKRIIKE